MNNFKKYLPSKNFATIILIIIVFISLFFVIKSSISFLKNKKTSKGGDTQIEMTVGSVVQKDSNNNGIADWEEYLWGLNPNKNGPENKEFILSKKKVLTQNGSVSASDESGSITENAMLSRQFFATIMSLQQTGQLDEAAISSISESIGQEIRATDIPDVYTKDMLVIIKDSDNSDIAYFALFNNLVTKYKESDIGSELTIVSQGIVNNDPGALYAAKTIATSYRLFGRELIKLPVPSSAALTNLSLANNYEKVAQSIEGLTQVISDPIVGMRAILNYKKYTDALGSDLEKMSGILQ